MAYEGYAAFSVSVAAGVATVTFADRAISLIDNATFGELARVGKALEADEAVRVVVLASAHPDYFVAHVDITEFDQVPPEPPVRSRKIGGVIGMMDRFRTMPKPTIAMIEGKCRGGGSELALACDMRFAAIGKAVFGQLEVGLGIAPGAGAMTRLARLMGRGRALEALLGGGDFSAEEAERYGWINRALPADQLRPFVTRLARRIASFPPETLALIKSHLSAGETGIEDALALEEALFYRSVNWPVARERIARALALGAQTAAVEDGDIEALWQAMDRN